MPRELTTAELILEYLKTLIWPAIAICVVVPLWGHVTALIERVTGESTEFSASALGVQIHVKLQERLAGLAKSSEMAGAPELRESIKKVATDVARDQFRALSSNFYGAPLALRREAARAIELLAPDLLVDDLLRFARSPNNGERVGAAIALGARIKTSRTLCEDLRVQSIVKELLDDPNSRVRYRAVDAAHACPELRSALSEQLIRLAAEDPNRDVRKRAGSAQG